MERDILVSEFVKIGYWELNEKYKSNAVLADLKLSGINFVLDSEFKGLTETIYAFMSGNEVLYIGETGMGIQSRFESYRYGFDKLRDTDNRVKIGITQELEAGNDVDIYYYKPTTQFEIGGEVLTIQLFKTVERYLISKMETKLNVQGRL